MATVEKIRRDIEKTKEKISEQQKRLRALEAQPAFLKAYASGLITLPEGMMEAEAAADPGENEMEDTEYEE